MKTRAILCLVGLVLVAVGAAVVYWPAGLLALGAGLYLDARLGMPK